jgi:hypothetical protein
LLIFQLFTIINHYACYIPSLINLELPMITSTDAPIATGKALECAAPLLVMALAHEGRDAGLESEMPSPPHYTVTKVGRGRKGKLDYSLQSTLGHVGQPPHPDILPLLQSYGTGHESSRGDYAHFQWTSLDLDALKPAPFSEEDKHALSTAAAAIKDAMQVIDEQTTALAQDGVQQDGFLFKKKTADLNTLLDTLTAAVISAAKPPVPQPRKSWLKKHDDVLPPLLKHTELDALIHNIVYDMHYGCLKGKVQNTEDTAPKQALTAAITVVEQTYKDHQALFDHAMHAALYQQAAQGIEQTRSVPDR